MKLERVSRFKSDYSVDGGPAWQGHALSETLSAELRGRRYEFRADGRNRFVLLVDGLETAEATHGGLTWEVRSDGESYELRPRSRWRHSYDVLAAGARIGAVRRSRGSVLCELPASVAPDVQAFIGFVALTLWKRAAILSSAAASSVATSGS